MPTLTDMFVPTEGMNYQFSDVVNCDDRSRPRKEWFDTTEYCLAMRQGIDTRRDFSQNIQWELPSTIRSGKKYEGKIYGHCGDMNGNKPAQTGFSYVFDGETVELFGASTSCIEQLFSDTYSVFSESGHYAWGQSFEIPTSTDLKKIPITKVKVGLYKTANIDSPARFMCKMYYKTGDASIIPVAESYNVVTASEISTDVNSMVTFHMPNPTFTSTHNVTNVLFLIYSYDSSNVPGLWFRIRTTADSLGSLEIPLSVGDEMGGIGRGQLYDASTDKLYFFYNTGPNGNIEIRDGRTRKLITRQTFFGELITLKNSIRGSYLYVGLGQRVWELSKDFLVKGRSTTHTYTDLVQVIALGIDSGGNLVFGDTRLFILTQTDAFYADPGAGFTNSGIPCLDNPFSTISYSLPFSSSGVFTGAHFMNDYPDNSMIFLYGTGDRRLVAWHVQQTSTSSNVNYSSLIPTDVDAVTNFLSSALYVGGVGQFYSFSLTFGSNGGRDASGPINTILVPGSGVIKGFDFVNSFSSRELLVAHFTGVSWFKRSGGSDLFPLYDPVRSFLSASEPYFGIISTPHGYYVSADSDQHYVILLGDKYQGGNMFSYGGGPSYTEYPDSDLKFVVCYENPLWYDGFNHIDYNVSVSYMNTRFPTRFEYYSVVSYNPFSKELRLKEGDIIPPSLFGVGDAITTARSAILQKYSGKIVYFSYADDSYGFNAVIDVAIFTSISPTSGYVSLILLEQLPAGVGFEGDLVYVFEKKETQILYPSLRSTGSGPGKSKLFSLSLNYDRNFYEIAKGVTAETDSDLGVFGYRQLEYFDNRLFGLNQAGTFVDAMNSAHIEIPGTSGYIFLRVDLGRERCYVIRNYGNFLITFFYSRLGVIKKKIVDEQNGLYIYEHEDVFDHGVYGPNAFVSDGTNLYIFGSDNILRSLTLIDSSIGVRAQGEDIGIAIQNYLDQVKGGDVVMKYLNNEIHMIWRKGSEFSRVFRYNPRRKAWMVDEYEYGGNFADLLDNIGPNRYISVGKVLGVRGGLDDLGKIIKQRIKMYGPVEMAARGKLLSLLSLKFRVGFDGFPMGGQIRLFYGGKDAKRKSWNLHDSPLVRDINEELTTGGTYGDASFGGYYFGGDYRPREQAMIKYPEYFDFECNVSDNMNYFTIEIYNDTGYGFTLCQFNPIYNTMNDLATPNKLVLPTNNGENILFR